LTQPLARVEYEEEDDFIVVQIIGEVDISNVGEVGYEVRNAVPNAVLGVVVDFSKTEYLDSSGIRMLFELAKRLRTRDQQLAVVAPGSGMIRRVLEIVEYEPLHPRVEDAIDYLRSASRRPPASGERSEI
jgi:anti-anti-sigma factor